MTELNPYIALYPYLNERRAVWREISRYVAKDVPGAKRVVELGAGYCDFINTFDAPERIAFDLNPHMAAHVDDDVRLFVGDALALTGLLPRSVNLFFASNFLEHLPASDIPALLTRVRTVLAAGGKLVLLQPNHRLCAENYFDDPTHQTAFDDRTLMLQLENAGFRIVRMVPGLLPFSMKSRLPKWPFLIRAYLASPWKPMAAQMYFVAEVA